MNRTKFSIWMLSVVLAAGCSESNDPSNDPASDSDRVPISLRATTAAPTGSPSRAVVNAGSTIEIQVAGWETNAESFSNYAAAPAWGGADSKTSFEVEVNASAKAPKEWNPIRYFNTDVVQYPYTYVQAWYPHGTLSEGRVTVANTDGREDFLLAQPVKCQRKQTSELKFKHATAQLQFVIKKAADLTVKEPQLTGLELQKVALPVGFDFTGGSNTVVWGEPADLPVSGITGVSIEENVGNSALSDVYAMVRPTESDRLLLGVTTSYGTFPNIEVRINNSGLTSDELKGKSGLLAGVVYKITLNFKNTEVKPEVTASVEDWIEGGVGSGDVK